MATNIKRHTQYYSGNGAPKAGDSFVSLNVYAHYFDRDTKKFYIYMGSGSWILDPEYQISGTVTPPTSTSAVSILVHPNGTDDTANLQNAIQQAKATGKPIELYGTYFISNKLVLDKDLYRLEIIGHKAKIKAKNQNAFTFFERVKPASNEEALGKVGDIPMYQAWYSFNDLELIGYNTQKGIAPGPCGGSSFNNLRFDSLGTGIELRFALNAEIHKPYFINCVNGAYIGCGDWTGADNANSQSNRTTITKAECYMPTNGNVAIKVENCSGVEVRNCTIEGHKVVNGVEFISDSSVVKDFLLYDTHFECVQGASNAFFKGRILGGTMKVEKAFGQYGAYFMDVASVSGLGYVEVSHVPWWVGNRGNGNGSGKMFKTNNISTHFHKCEAWGDMPTSFWDTPQSKCGDGSEGQSFCGYNKFTYTKTPR